MSDEYSTVRVSRTTLEELRKRKAEKMAETGQRLSYDRLIAEHLLD